MVAASSGDRLGRERIERRHGRRLARARPRPHHNVPRAFSRLRDYLNLSPSTPISLLMREYGFHDPVIGMSAMCASGGAALLTAKLIHADVVDDVVVLATDLSAAPELVTQFVRLGVAITDVEPDVACRPFQSSSRGFTFGEAYELPDSPTGPEHRTPDFSAVR